MRTDSRSARRLLLALVVVLGVGLSVALRPTPAGAVPGPTGPTPVTRSNTDLVMSGTGAGQGVAGGIAPVGSTFNPLDGYPADVPAGFDPLNESFAGVILARSQISGATLSMYCIDIRTSTYPGIGYERGTWDESNVPNVGYVARILTEYYPTTALPTAANDNVRAAAVQSAIWFLTDKYVLTAADPVRPLVAAIVADVLAQGPLAEPPPPDLGIQPDSARAPAPDLAGPFTITAETGATITVSATGGTMYADAAGAVPIPDGATVPPGQQVWLRADAAGPASAALEARGVVTAPSGNVYLYDGNTPGVEDAQRLILARTASVASDVTAQAEFFDTGSLVVTKTIGGPAAGMQDQVVIQPTCNGVALDPFVIPAGATGSQSRTYTGIETPATCTVTETADGSNDAVTVTTVGSGQQVTLPQNSVPTDLTAADITDTYGLAPGALVVTKTITGTAAGQQGPVVLHVSCTSGLEQDISIPAQATGDTVHRFDGIPAGSTCSVRESSDGATATVDVEVTAAADVTITPGAQASAHVTDTYTEVSEGTGEIESEDVQPEQVQPGEPTEVEAAEELPRTGPVLPLRSLLAGGVGLIAAGALLELMRRR